MSYSTVQEADAYVETHYLSDAVERDRWDDLCDEDKQVLLNKSFEIIEHLPITGRKSSVDQSTAFPRYPETEVPTSVKNAEIELAISLSDAEAIAETNEYLRMAEFGISSYSVGNFRETIGSAHKASYSARTGLVSKEAERYLAPWLCGGFNVCRH